MILAPVKMSTKLFANHLRQLRFIPFFYLPSQLEMQYNSAPAGLTQKYCCGCLKIFPDSLQFKPFSFLCEYNVIIGQKSALHHLERNEKTMRQKILSFQKWTQNGTRGSSETGDPRHRNVNMASPFPKEVALTPSSDSMGEIPELLSCNRKASPLVSCQENKNDLNRLGTLFFSPGHDPLIPHAGSVAVSQQTV